MIKNDKLTHLEKLQRVQGQADRIERMAEERDRVQAVDILTDDQGNEKNVIQQEFEKVD